MEHRVKCMLLLLGEEADSFSKRAEMYYKRRPEVITQVEEVYRAYRALADRYDIMSGELHKANHTIATAFPDQVQYAMLEEEDDNIPKAFTPVDPRKIHKSTVDGLMKKKKGEQIGGGEKNGTSVPINKENAGEEISRLQKAILVMQTEKEFIKSSYESGIAKYWDLEKEINDMQEQVCHFQDKFDESAVIEDDEARALMTATALKSCEDTIMKLQEHRKASAGQVMGESERVKVFREKLKVIMNKHGKSLPDPDLSDKNTRKNHDADIEDAYHAKQGGIETQAVIDKIKEHFERDCNLSMAEVTERIDELVNKVVDLELMVSSQTSHIDRLCRENNELENSLQSLDDENTVMASGSSELAEKLRQVEEELTRVQALESSFHKDESTISSNFVEAINKFSDISELLLSSVCEHHTDSVSAQTSNAPRVESTEPSSNEYYDMKEVGLQIDEPHADSVGPTTGVVKRDDPDDVLVARVDDSSGGTKSNEQQLDIGQDNISRERGSLVRLRHISSDNFGGYDEREDISKVGPSLADGITNMMKLQERLSNSLDDKEKALLGEYTSLLEEYKDMKRRLTEMEEKNQDCLNEIRSLRGEIASTAGEGGNEGSCKRSSGSFSRRGHRRTPSYSSIHQRRPSVSSISRLIRMGPTVAQEGEEQQGGFNREDLRLPAVVEAENASNLEERFRRDIDTLLDENLEFWMKFSSSLQRVQEFQSKHEGLQVKLLNNKEEGKQDGAMEKQLRALKTELQVWSEQNAMLRGELQCRFTSLCDIQEEITAALDMEADRFTSYQAAKFQGEVLNMQQENNRVSDELQVGLDHVKGLQAEVEQALGKLHIRSVSLPVQMAGGAEDSDDSGGPGSSSGSAHGGSIGSSNLLGRPPSNKSKVPLQSFLFPAKKKTSLLARVTPVLQKQQAEMKFLAKLPR
jgi:predicted  nucleic acid-binding Zn-ribbon protein